MRELIGRMRVRTVSGLTDAVPVTLMAVATMSVVDRVVSSHAMARELPSRVPREASVVVTAARRMVATEAMPAHQETILPRMVSVPMAAGLHARAITP